MCIDNAENQYKAASLDAERVALQAMELFPDMEPEALRLCALVTKSYGNARTEGQEPTISSKEEQLERQLQAMQMRVTELEQALVASKKEQKPKAKVKAVAAQKSTNKTFNLQLPLTHETMRTALRKHGSAPLKAVGDRAPLEVVNTHGNVGKRTTHGIGPTKRRRVFSKAG